MALVVTKMLITMIILGYIEKHESNHIDGNVNEDDSCIDADNNNNIDEEDDINTFECECNLIDGDMSEDDNRMIILIIN